MKSATWPKFFRRGLLSRCVRYRDLEAAELPRGWGIAYRMPEMQVIVLAPIPFNLIIGWRQKVWRRILDGVAPGSVENEIAAAYEEGYDAGSADFGFLRGRKLGEEAAYRRMAILERK